MQTWFLFSSVMWNMKGPRRRYLYFLFCFQTVAPLMATSMPVAVSPILMLEVSTAATMVFSWFGFNCMGCGFSWKFCV